MKYYAIQYQADRVLSVLVEAKNKDVAIRTVEQLKNAKIIKCEELFKSEFVGFKKAGGELIRI